MCPSTDGGAHAALQLKMTPRISDFLSQAAVSDTIDHGLKKSALNHVRQESVAWELLRSLANDLSSVPGKEAVLLHQVCKGSSVFHPRPAPRARSAELERILEQRRRLVEERQYKAMVLDITKEERAAEEARSQMLSTYRDQMSFALHVLTMMATFFFGGWLLGAHISPKPAVRTACSVIGMVLALLLETVLFAVRSIGVEMGPPPDVMRRKRRPSGTAGGTITKAEERPTAGRTTAAAAAMVGGAGLQAANGSPLAGGAEPKKER